MNKVLPAVALIALSLISMFFWDQQISLLMSEMPYKTWYSTAQSITDIGLGEYWFGTALIILILSKWVVPRFRLSPARLALNENLRRWSGSTFLALLGSGIMLRFFKWLVGRQRPHRTETYEPLIFEPFNNDWHFQSYPSGHTQVLFSFFTCLGLLWPKARWFFWTIAAVLSFTRVITHQHFFSDVIAGAVLGIFGSWLTLYWLRNKVLAPVAFSELPKNH